MGVDGQRALGSARALLVGAGATGSALAEGLVRAGLGSLILIDRDLVELSNITRQALYVEADIGYPKALVAAKRLGEIGGATEIIPQVADANGVFLEPLLEGCDLLLDGSDNFRTRFTLNDLSLRESIPWIYTAAQGSVAVSMPVLPGQTACLACLYPTMPADGLSCDEGGIIQPAAACAAAMSGAEALKILSGNIGQVRREMWTVDLWRGDFARVSIADRRDDCPACVEGRYEHLGDEGGTLTVTRLCARSLQVMPAAGERPPDFDAILKRHGAARLGPHAVELAEDELRLTLFPDGRALIEGDLDEREAGAIYQRYFVLD